MKIIKQLKNKRDDIIAWSIGVPMIVLCIGSILAFLVLPIILVIWLIQQLF